MTTVAATRSKTYDLVYIAVFAVVMAVCSMDPHLIVPFTLQTFGVFMAVGGLLEERGNSGSFCYASPWSRRRSGICGIFRRNRISLEMQVDILSDLSFPHLLCGPLKVFLAESRLFKSFPSLDYRMLCILEPHGLCLLTQEAQVR